MCPARPSWAQKYDSEAMVRVVLQRDWEMEGTGNVDDESRPLAVLVPRI